MPLEVECLVADEERSLPVAIALPLPRYSLPQRLRSGYHALRYRLGERLSWSRGVYCERPVRRLNHLNGIQQARIAALQRRFAVQFEQNTEHLTALKSYDYLDILGQAWSMWGRSRSVGGVVQNVGSSNFWYARVLHAFFHPTKLTGIEVEGHRIYFNGYSRWDYACGYIQDLPNTEFVIGDYAKYRQAADVVVAWYPFVLPAPVLAWRLPLSLLAPHALFSRIAQNLKPNGLFVMVNQGAAEAAIAGTLCSQVGLECQDSCELRSTLRSRRASPVVSCWAVTSPP